MIRERWKQMNRAERIAWVVGIAALAVSVAAGYLIHRGMLFLVPLLAIGYAVMLIAAAVENWRRKRLMAILALIGGIAIAVVELYYFIF